MAARGSDVAAGAIESAAINAVTGVAEINRKLFGAVYEDTQAAFTAVEKLAGTKSLAEGYQLYIDYLRERAEVGMTRAKNVAEFVSDKAADGFKTVQDGVSKAANFSKQAA